MATIKKLIEIISSPSHKSRYLNAMTSHSCIICGKDADVFQNALAQLEYKCSGICQSCQNLYFG